MAKKGMPELRIEPIEHGGFLVHHTPPDSGKGPLPQPKKFAFEDHESMIDHVAKHTLPDKPKTMKESMHQSLAKLKSVKPADEEHDDMEDY